MRRAFRTTFVVGVLAVSGLSAASIAAAAPSASSSAVAARCGNGQYQKKCTKPKFTYRAPSAKCQAIGASFDVPKITFTSDAGLRRITVKLGGNKTVKTVSFKGDGPTQYTLSGLKIATKGLSSGSHNVLVAATDVMHKTTSSTMHFVICKPKAVATKPVFTG
jgi:hypothetical protein